MEPISSTSSPDKPGPMLSLMECSTRLRDEVGDQAPAYITLKRWSASGRLNDAMDRHPGRRPVYDYAAVLRLVGRPASGPRSPLASASQLAEVATASSPPVPSISGPSSGDLELLLKRLLESQAAQAAAITELSQAVAPLLQHAAGMASAVEQLDAVRKMLMRSCDAEVTSARQRLELAQKEIARLSELANPVSQAKTVALLGRVEEALRVLQAP